MDDLSEKEQIEQMRAWWSEYGNYVIGGIVVGIGLMVATGALLSRMNDWIADRIAIKRGG